MRASWQQYGLLMTVCSHFKTFVLVLNNVAIVLHLVIDKNLLVIQTINDYSKWRQILSYLSFYIQNFLQQKRYWKIYESIKVLYYNISIVITDKTATIMIVSNDEKERIINFTIIYRELTSLGIYPSKQNENVSVCTVNDYSGRLAYIKLS